jgi:predicted PolB exonuclease-like 3'-5' exonuclease
MYFFFEDLKANTFYSVKEELFDSFNSRYPEKKSYTTQNKITINFRKWCEYKGYKPDDNRNGGSTKLSYIIPEKKEEIQDLLDLAINEIEEGGSMYHEISLCMADVEQLIKENCN